MSAHSTINREFDCPTHVDRERQRGLAPCHRSPRDSSMSTASCHDPSVNHRVVPIETWCFPQLTITLLTSVSGALRLRASTPHASAEFPKTDIARRIVCTTSTPRYGTLTVQIFHTSTNLSSLPNTTEP